MHRLVMVGMYSPTTPAIFTDLIDWLNYTTDEVTPLFHGAGHPSLLQRDYPSTIKLSAMTIKKRIHSVILNKCPRCGEGGFFISKTAYTKNFEQMHKNCPHCGLPYVPEPGFYQGALYMSYAFYVAFMLIYFLLFTVFLSDYYQYFLISIIPILTILTPVMYRLARRSWLAIFIKPEHL